MKWTAPAGILRVEAGICLGPGIDSRWDEEPKARGATPGS